MHQMVHKVLFIKTMIATILVTCGVMSPQRVSPYYHFIRSMLRHNSMSLALQTHSTILTCAGMRRLAQPTQYPMQDLGSSGFNGSTRICVASGADGLGSGILPGPAYLHVPALLPAPHPPLKRFLPSLPTPWNTPFHLHVQTALSIHILSSHQYYYNAGLPHCHNGLFAYLQR